MIQDISMTRFIFSVIRPTLEDMDMWSAAAEKLLALIAAHESMGLQFRTQKGGGPALGFFQMEPATFADLVVVYLGQVNPDRLPLLAAFLTSEEQRNGLQTLARSGDTKRWLASKKQRLPLLDALRDNDPFSVAAARLHLARIPDPLPDVEDSLALAHYAKAHWNRSGKATAEKYLSDFMRYRPDARPIEWGAESDF